MTQALKELLIKDTCLLTKIIPGLKYVRTSILVAEWQYRHEFRGHYRSCSVQVLSVKLVTNPEKAVKS